MEYTLKDYQVDAVGRVLDNLAQARNLYHQPKPWHSRFALSATTGAGKTVMAAAVIEALFFGSDEFDFAADPGAVVLWFSDDPSLNEQSRGRIQAASNELDSRLRIIESTFSEPKLRPGNVYFLNAQKLSKGSRLVRGDRNGNGDELALVTRPDTAQNSIYDIITETIADERLTLYFVLDEAHRGWSTAANDRATIVQRLVNGHGQVPPMPVVWGISATTQRFEDAMKDSPDRVALPAVEVDSALVQASGLLKDDIVLSIPAESGVFDTVLLKRAVRKVIASTKAWADYAKTQEEADPVVPLLVVQVPDGEVTPVLNRAVDAIFEEWPDLPSESFANVFGEHTDLYVSQVPIPYVAPERVQESPWIRVLFAKTAISTGWDCPRAEVLVSFRPAVDPTHITQLLGRMVRTPLARRIPGNEVLNSVECLLPFFDRRAAIEVAHELMRGATGADGAADSSGGPGRRVLFDPVTLLPNPSVPDDVWERFDSIPSQSLPKRNAKPIKRLTALAHALSDDGLIADAGKKAHAHLHAVLDGRSVQYKAKIEAAVNQVLAMEGEELRGKLHSNTAISRSYFTDTADHRAIQDAYRAAGRVFSAELARTYVGHLAGDQAGDDELRDATVQLASLALVPEVIADVEAEANRLASDWLLETRVARKGLTDERQAVYDDLESMTTTPQPTLLARPKTGQANTKMRDAAGNECDLPTRSDHLLCDENGAVPIDLNPWEVEVLDREMSNSGFVAWWRNPGRTAKDSLAIAYKDPASGAYKALRPDFIFFARHLLTGTQDEHVGGV
ncbi:DEAD/DEAH box helicase, partial [Mycobacterium hubeiense]|uniref:DEAD/DEAH box helicase n=1 Tax=Mycobacterium hubeiense TaxID=1867256 RepID=UPI000C7F082F